MALKLEDGLHPRALGIEKHATSRFVRQLQGDRLSIKRVLILAEPYEMEVRALPRNSERRPAVFCPFCGQRGKYHHTENRHHFCHGSGEESCAASALETVLHRRAKRLLVTELARARAASRPIRCIAPCRRCGENKAWAILEPNSWSDEVEELGVAGLARLDVATRSGDAVTMALEVHVTNPVSDEKVAHLIELGIPGVELEALALIDAETGAARWRHNKPLQPSRTWGLERAPRSFMVCDDCRTIDSTSASAIRLFDALAHQDSVCWRRVCQSLKTTEEWRRALAEAPAPASVLKSAFAPELQREDPSLPDPFAIESASQFISDALGRLELAAFGRRCWPRDTPLLPDPYAALVKRFTSLIGSFDKHREAIQDSRKLWLDQLQFAERVRRLAQLQITDNYWKAWIGYGLIVEATRFGNTTQMLYKVCRYVARVHMKNRSESTACLMAEVRRIGSNELITLLEKGARVGLSSLVASERECARLIGRMSEARVKRVEFNPRYEGLTPEQRGAIVAARDHRIVLLTGGAGTGKTTVTKSVIRSFPKLSWIVLAPTGKATQRLRGALENVPNVAKTYTVAMFLARLKDPPERYSVPRFNAIAIDEFGFLGVEQLQMLLRQIERRAHRVLLVGDPNQLPSISPGAVMSDLLKVASRRRSRISEVRLSTNHRARDSAIAALGERVRASRRWPRPQGGDELTLVDPIGGHVTAVVSEYKRLMGSGHGECQIVAPTRQLVEDLNQRLQDVVNKRGATLSSNSGLRVGDRFVCTWNLYRGEFELMNGTLGTIVRETARSVVVKESGTGREIRVPVDDAKHLSLGYAITIHKAQGSEWNDVVVVVPGDRGFVRRSMLYTAITRARSRLSIVARVSDLDAAIGAHEFRCTYLQEHLNAVTRCTPEKTIGRPRTVSQRRTWVRERQPTSASRSRLRRPPWSR